MSDEKYKTFTPACASADRYMHARRTRQANCAVGANNAPEETERFIGRQMILLCEQALMIRNRTVAPSNTEVGNGSAKKNT